MVVKKKVSSSIKNFIDKGADVKQKRDNAFEKILIRIPHRILDQIEEILAKKPWTNRTQWIVEAIYQKIKSDTHDEQEENLRAGDQ